MVCRFVWQTFRFVELITPANAGAATAANNDNMAMTTISSISVKPRLDVIIRLNPPDSKIIYPWHRKIVSRVYFFLIKILFGLPIHDTQTGLKLFKAEVLEKVLPKILVKEFAYDLEVLVNARHLGYRIVEAPVVVHSQKRYGRIGIRSIYKTWIDTLAIFYRLNILKYYDQPPKE